jgi:hypothetical protein
MDAQLSGVLASTYFGGVFGNGAKTIALDARRNVYFGGYTSPRSLSARTPFQQRFGQSFTGYVAELGRICPLCSFPVNLATTKTGLPSQNVWANSLIITDAPPLRIDAIQNQATQFSDPLSAGETIVIQGAGFDSSAQLLIGGIAATSVSISPANIVAIVPAGLSGAAATVRVVSGGSASNTVLSALASQL